AASRVARARHDPPAGPNHRVRLELARRRASPPAALAGRRPTAPLEPRTRSHRLDEAIRPPRNPPARASNRTAHRGGDRGARAVELPGRFLVATTEPRREATRGDEKKDDPRNEETQRGLEKQATAWAPIRARRAFARRPPAHEPPSGLCDGRSIHPTTRSVSDSRCSSPRGWTIASISACEASALPMRKCSASRPRGSTSARA